MKIRRLGVECFQADVQTGMSNIMVAVRNYAYAPKITVD